MKLTRKELLERYHPLIINGRKPWPVADILFISLFVLYLLYIGSHINISFPAPVLPQFWAVASEPVVEPGGTLLPNPTPSPTPGDKRVGMRTKFLKEKKSPLAPHAALIISEADTYDIGWTKIVAISGIESKYGVLLPDGSHNAWGIGGSKFRHFKNWEESIKYTTRLLANNYRLNELKGVKAKYCPASDGCNPKWAEIVQDNSEAILAYKE